MKMTTTINMQAKCISKFLMARSSRKWVTRFCYQFQTPSVSDARLQDVVNQLSKLAAFGVAAVYPVDDGLVWLVYEDIDPVKDMGLNPQTCAEEIAKAVAGRLAYDAIEAR